MLCLVVYHWNRRRRPCVFRAERRFVPTKQSLGTRQSSSRQSTNTHSNNNNNKLASRMLLRSEAAATAHIMSFTHTDTDIRHIHTNIINSFSSYEFCMINRARSNGVILCKYLRYLRKSIYGTWIHNAYTRCLLDFMLSTAHKHNSQA